MLTSAETLEHSQGGLLKIPQVSARCEFNALFAVLPSTSFTQIVDMLQYNPAKLLTGAWCMLVGVLIEIPQCFVFFEFWLPGLHPFLNHEDRTSGASRNFAAAQQAKNTQTVRCRRCPQASRQSTPSPEP